MAEIIGEVARTEVRNGTQVTVFSIPALSATGAKQRARFNARFKGLRNFQTDDAEKVKDADIPGQSIYEVKVTSSSS